MNDPDPWDARDEIRILKDLLAAAHREIAAQTGSSAVVEWWLHSRDETLAEVARLRAELARRDKLRRRVDVEGWVPGLLTAGILLTAVIAWLADRRSRR